MPYLSFAAICLLFGSNFYLMDLSSQALGPVGVGAARTFGAAVVLAAIWRLTAPASGVPRDKWLRCFCVGLLANGYPYVVQPYLIGTAKAMTSATGEGAGHSFFGTMVAFTPLITILVSIPMIGVRPTPRQLIGVLVGLVFMGLLVLDGSERGVSPTMLLMALSVPTSYAVANTYLRRSLNDIPATALTAALLVGPAVVLLPLAFCDSLLEPYHLAAPAEPQNWPTAIAAVATLGLLGTGLTMWLFVRLVQTEGPLFAGMVTYVVPLVALFWGNVDREQITPLQVGAIAGVLAMVALVQYQPPKREAADTTPATNEV